MLFTVLAYYFRHNKVISGIKSQYTTAILTVSHNIKNHNIVAQVL